LNVENIAFIVNETIVPNIAKNLPLMIKYVMNVFMFLPLNLVHESLNVLNSLSIVMIMERFLVDQSLFTRVAIIIASYAEPNCMDEQDIDNEQAIMSQFEELQLDQDQE